VAIATQQHAEIVEPADDTLQFHAIDEENGEGNLVFANVIKKGVLKVGSAFDRHIFSTSAFFL
jgi:hypothetical protein